MDVLTEIRVRRFKKGITQSDLGKLLGVSKQTVYKIEKGLIPIPRHHFIILRDALEIPAEELIKHNLQFKFPDYRTNKRHNTPITRTSSSSTVLDRLAEEMKAAAVRNAGMRWSRYIADIREITERHFRRFDEQERERVFAEISTHPDRPPAVAVEYMARRIIEQMVPAAAAETKEATE